LKVTPKSQEKWPLAPITVWLREIVHQSGMPKKSLAREALGHSSAAYLRQLLKGKALPTASTVRKIAEAADTPAHIVLAALAHGGYADEIVDYVAALQRVGIILCKQARVEIDPTQGVKDAWVAGYSASIAGRPHRPPRRQLSPVAFSISPLTMESDATRLAGFIVLPKPTALAIELAIMAFPRRGDIVSIGSSNVQKMIETFARPWTQDAVNKIIHGQNERLVLPMLLREARAILRARTVTVNSRRDIAAEFIQAWADSICSAYSDIARQKFYVRIGATGEVTEDPPITWQRIQDSLFPAQSHRENSS